MCVAIHLEASSSEFGVEDFARADTPRFSRDIEFQKFVFLLVLCDVDDA